MERHAVAGPARPLPVASVGASMPGKTDTNLRAGALAEGVGREILRRFSAVATVPREEDVGVDAMCTLLRRDGRALFAEDSFGVQFKSASVREIRYEGHEARWLRKLDVPFLMGSVDLAASTLQLYSTENAHARYVHPRAEFDLVLCLDAPGRQPIANRCGLYDLGWEHAGPAGAARCWLGTPLLRCSFTEAASPGFAEHAYQRLKPWLEFSAESRRLRSYGVHREVSLDGSAQPKAMSYYTASQEGDLNKLLSAVDPLLWRLAGMLGHVFNEGPLLKELRGVRRFMESRGLTPIGLWEDPPEGQSEAKPDGDGPPGKQGRVLVSWMGAPTTPNAETPEEE